MVGPPSAGGHGVLGSGPVDAATPAHSPVAAAFRRDGRAATSTRRPVDLVGPALREQAAAVARRGGAPAATTGVEPGDLVAPVRAAPAQLAQLVRTHLTAEGARVVWSRRGAEVTVDLQQTRVGLADGTLGFAFHLDTMNAGSGAVNVIVAIGDPGTERGLVAATPGRPFGPPQLVDQWGDSVLAAAWDALVVVASALAAAAGRDTTGDPLEPAALRASARGLEVVPQAAFRSAPVEKR